MKKSIIFLFLDVITLIFCFYFFIFLKYDQLHRIEGTEKAITYFLVLWIILSTITGKYNKNNFGSFKDLLSSVTFANLVILGFTVILIRIWKTLIEFRFIIIYTVFLASTLELAVGYFFSLFQTAMKTPFSPDDGENGTENQLNKDPESIPQIKIPILPEAPVEIISSEALIDLSSIIVEETDLEIFNFIRHYFSKKIVNTLIISTTTVFNIYNQIRPKYEVIINLKRINDIQFINKFFETVNSKLNMGGIFIDWVETYSQRKSRILSKYPWGIDYLFYTFDFLINRVLPKLNITKRFYFLITGGQNRVISKAETYGRLYSCGFEIIDEQFINNRLVFVFKKIAEPRYDNHPTYGPIIKLQRIGKNGRIIGVFKLRTMHAYSEYLQNYIYTKHALDEGGKFKNDFRVTTIGKVLRVLWIDEFPMLINVFILRNMKIVGVRPLSPHYFSLYNEVLKQKRILTKPGLIPPYYAQYPTPKTLDEIQDNEMNYLEEYEKHPFLTDIKYFFKAMFFIIFKKARSK